MTIHQVNIKDAPECTLGWDAFPPEALDEFIHRLSAAVVLKAILDAACGSITRMKRQKEAIAWLCDPENEDTWFLLAGVTRRHVLSWIQAGCKKDWLQHRGLEHVQKKYYPEYELKLEPRQTTYLPHTDPDLGIEY